MKGLLVAVKPRPEGLIQASGRFEGDTTLIASKLPGRIARLRPVPPELLAERKRKLLAATRLTPFLDRPMKNLSGGMKLKLGLICTLIHGPQLIILDEPSTGVDPVSRQEFWAILTEQVAEAGMTALVSTAYMDEATRFDRIALCYGGRVLTQGQLEELLHAAEGVIVQITAPRADLVAEK